MSSQKKSKQIELNKMQPVDNNIFSTKSYISRNELTKQNKVYVIHDNGGRPYKVFINKNNLKIYGMYEDQYYTSMQKIKYRK